MILMPDLIIMIVITIPTYHDCDACGFDCQDNDDDGDNDDDRDIVD